MANDITKRIARVAAQCERQKGYRKGYWKGYDAGLEEGRRRAMAEIRELRERWSRVFEAPAIEYLGETHDPDCSGCKACEAEEDSR